MPQSQDFGTTLERLSETIDARKGAAADTSYTASLLAKGAARCAKKLGEEAVELAIAAAEGDKAAVREEAADVLYHLLVLLAATDVTPAEVAAVLAAREGVSGHDEKAARPKA